VHSLRRRLGENAALTLKFLTEVTFAGLAILTFAVLEPQRVAVEVTLPRMRILRTERYGNTRAYSLGHG
jgi:hypothetical protein